jgi:hypothetical protein
LAASSGGKLEGDKAVQLYILAFIDHTHPPAAQLLDDPVMRDGLPNNRLEILGSSTRQVNEVRGIGAAPAAQLS